MAKNRQPTDTRALVRVPVALALMLAPFAAAQAYVGPGAGLSLLGALWGVVAAIGAALLFVIMWPIRRMRRRKREEASRNDAQRSASADNEHSSNS